MRLPPPHSCGLSSQKNGLVRATSSRREGQEEACVLQTRIPAPRQRAPHLPEFLRPSTWARGGAGAGVRSGGAAWAWGSDTAQVPGLGALHAALRFCAGHRAVCKDADPHPEPSRPSSGPLPIPGNRAIEGPSCPSPFQGPALTSE